MPGTRRPRDDDTFVLSPQASIYVNALDLYLSRGFDNDEASDLAMRMSRLPQLLAMEVE